MSDFKKDNNLMGGKGEDDIDWITVKGNHIPIKDGESPKEAVENYFKKVEQTEGKRQIQRLVSVLQKIKAIKMKNLAALIQNFKPIKLNIEDKEILAEFDKYGARKNIYGHGKSDNIGYNYKISNAEKLPQIISNSKYLYSKEEQGKNKPQHKDVKMWHYFTKKINTDKGILNIVVNVRDTGDKNYVYEVAIRRKKT